MRELAVIDMIKRRAGQPPGGVKKGIGDDCAVLADGRGGYILWASDMLTEGVHFSVKRAGYARIGRKAVAVNISDIAAMGGEPEHILVSLGVPSGIRDSSIRAIYDGIFSICGDYGMTVLGGDLTASRSLVIDVSVIGRASRGRLTTRDGARVGDKLLITAPCRNGRREHLDFRPRLDQARYLTRHYRVNAMIDVSDGIAMDLGRMASASRVGARLYTADIPLSRGLCIEDALFYGESFELLFSMKPGDAEELTRKKKTEYAVIGTIVPEKKGLIRVDPGGRESPLKMKGYRHL
ncbi:MAG: hypothetical protein GF409_00795 [Candidatus Omnitrophica bacterium]|nr:hypothetical protein [Candidatus Omnitrophota bacterium]